ncbi:MAG: hypothetical protein AB7O57_09265 [Hyphomicrobiaceae bacterium]
MSKLIHVAPAPGMKIIDPFQRGELKAGTRPDDPYWRAREREGGVIITEVGAAAVPPRPAREKAPPAAHPKKEAHAHSKPAAKS